MELNEPAIAYEKQKYTIEEYLEMENAAIEKHEYYQGYVYAMSGNKWEHILVTRNIQFALEKKLEDGPCQPSTSEGRIYIEKNSLFTYPDVSVFCGEVLSLEDKGLNFLNPTVIFEVLSDSTRVYEKNEKFRLYRDIPTLKSYILVEPEEISVETFHINSAGTWQREEYKELNASLPLHHIGISIDLTEIYRKTRILNQ